MKAYRIIVTGITQGVGFRPFVFRLAKKFGVKGYVRNLGGAEVEIFLEGLDSPRAFVDALRREKPPTAIIERIIVEEAGSRGYEEFQIHSSGSSREVLSQIPPDFSICDECLREIEDPNSRFYRYPFHSCVWCGPRFSMIYDVPYDRKNTSMRDFPLCEVCEAEYRDPNNIRRFHAQGISCPICGPKLWLVDKYGNRVAAEDPLKVAANLIDEGEILAIKGIGGFHIAALATDDEVVSVLRKRKKRPQKPFAIMALNLDVVKKIAVVGEREKRILLSPQRPIVLLRQRDDSRISGLVAPGLDSIGVMIAYTGLHYLLLKETKDKFLIMTSGNPKGKPIVIDNDEALKKLSNVADYFILHNRKIVNRVDDSVVRFSNGKPVLLRRSRGYVPTWIEIPVKARTPIVAFGAELQNAGGILLGNKAILTQYVGDTDEYENLIFLEKALKFLLKTYRVESSNFVVVADMHPRYSSRRLAQEFSKSHDSRILYVQHHKAHLASVLAESGVAPYEKIVGIAIDGVGYGEDGAIWGGEVFFGTLGNLRRVGHLEYLPMPGGDLATINPVRMLIGILSRFLDENEIRNLLSRRGILISDKELRLIVFQAKNGKSPITSSLGRVLDSISALLGVCFKRTYEGEPAMKLEAFSREGRTLEDIEIGIYKEGDMWIVDTTKFFEDLLGVIEKDLRDLARTAQYLFGFALGEIASKFASSSDRDVIFVSGGAAVNDYILEGIREAAGLDVVGNVRVPRGDGGIALGQLYLGVVGDAYE